MKVNKKEKKKICRTSEPQSENQRKRKEGKVLRTCLRTKKAVELEIIGDTNCYWRTWNGLQRLGKETWKSEDELRQSKLVHFLDDPEY